MNPALSPTLDRRRDEEDAIFRRLRNVALLGKSTILCFRHESMDAALRLQRKGIVSIEPGAGIEEGCLVVSYTTMAPPKGRPDHPRVA